MSELHPSEDKAVLYVMDGLTSGERREFETELANSTELRALVRELQESAILLARSSPQHRPPPKVWQAIEDSVAAESRHGGSVPAFWVAWWRYGWAAAAACLLCWLFYAFWINRPATDLSKNTLPSQAASPTDSSPTRALSDKNAGNSPHSSNKLAILPHPSDAAEIARLRREVTELQNRISGLSQSVAQQQALLGETNRLKFFHLTSGAGGGPTAAPAPLSPALQYALFAAMARELGWAPTTDTSPSATGIIPPLTTNPTNIDFLDLRTTTNAVANSPQDQSNNQPSTHATPENAAGTNAAPIAIPAFTSGNNVIVAIDQSVVPAGTQLNFLNQDQQSIGTTNLGDNTIVVTIPTSVNGGPIYITTGGLISPINVFQFFNPGTAYP